MQRSMAVKVSQPRLRTMDPKRLSLRTSTLMELKVDEEVQRVKSLFRRITMMMRKSRRTMGHQGDLVELGQPQVREVNHLPSNSLKTNSKIGNRSNNNIYQLKTKLADSVGGMTRTLMMSHLTSTIGKNALCFLNVGSVGRS